MTTCQFHFVMMLPLYCNVVLAVRCVAIISVLLAQMSFSTSTTCITRMLDAIVSECHHISSVHGNVEPLCTQRAIEILAHHVATQAPLIPINATCVLPAPLADDAYRCGDYPEAFSGARYETPSKLGIIIHFAFEVDTLEIALHEYAGVVDWVFLVEATHAHRKKTPKPLMWEHIRYQPRFRALAHNVVHFVVDDSELPNVDRDTTDIFDMEYYQWKRAWQHFVAWNALMHEFGQNDVIGFGDADEVTTRHSLERLKRCVMHAGELDIGAWFAYGRLDTIYASDFPAHGHRYTWGSPTFYNLWRIQSMRRDYASKQRGTTGKCLLGGMHMTQYGYLPNVFLKSLTATEYGITLQGIQAWRDDAHRDLLTLEQLQNVRVKSSRLVSIASVASMPDVQQTVRLPWFLHCNPQRYAAWHGAHDTRVC